MIQPAKDGATNPVRGSENLVLRDTPAHTNQSHQPKLYGWCGSYNDTNTTACGIAKVIAIARNGRVKVQSLEGDDLREALSELGYPGLS